MRFRFPLLLGLLFLLPPSLGAQEHTLRGQVTDPAGEPVHGAVVALEGPEARRVVETDPSGRFIVPRLAPGEYRLRVDALGFASVRRTVEVGGAGAELRITLETRPVSLEPLSVTAASRVTELVEELPQAVTVVGAETLEAQVQLSGDLGEVLAQTVPALAVSTESLSNFGQTLRGRDIGVLVDGIPQNTPLRDVLRGLRTVDPAALERIETVPGATAAYGYGGAGGVLNLVTRRPSAPGIRFRSEVGIRSQPTDFGESLTTRFRQSAEGAGEAWDWLLSGSVEDRGYFFDAEGDRIPPDPHLQGGLANGTQWSLLGRLGFRPDELQRVEISASHYDDFQELEFASEAGDGKARAVEAEVPGLDPGTRNTLVRLGYEHADLLASRLQASAYVQDYTTRFGFSSFFPDGGGQSFLTSEKVGARATFRTPVALLGSADLQWGVDLLRDETAQPLEDGRMWVPPIEQWAVAPFAQIAVESGRFSARAGVRHERVSLEVDDFEPLFGDETVQGGELDFQETVFNAGLVARLTGSVDVFGGFSQGFSVVDVGRTLRGLSGGSVEDFAPEAQVVDSWEAGVRGGTERVRGAVTAFYNSSELGTVLGDAPEFRVIRSPERIYGAEVSVDVRATDRLGLGSAFAWSEGERDTDEDGEYETYLPGFRIAPPKATAYVTHRTTEAWDSRLQLLWSGDRDRFPGSDAFGEGAVESYLVVDLLTRLRTDWGVLTFGVDNLLDEEYLPPISQWYNFGFARAAGRGRTLSLSWSTAW